MGPLKGECVPLTACKVPRHSVGAKRVVNGSLGERVRGSVGGVSLAAPVGLKGQSACAVGCRCLGRTRLHARSLSQAVVLKVVSAPVEMACEAGRTMQRQACVVRLGAVRGAALLANGSVRLVLVLDSQVSRTPGAASPAARVLGASAHAALWGAPS